SIQTNPPGINSTLGLSYYEIRGFQNQIRDEQSSFPSPSFVGPKARRGLGLRKARELNQAYLMKLEWPFLKTLINKLWVRVVTRKYLKETDSVPIHHRKSGGSSLWREICSVWHEMRIAKETFFLIFGKRNLSENPEG
ncbi:hypothetical protein LINPERHAP1_LOCUS13617, partial [Linum perenne]